MSTGDIQQKVDLLPQGLAEENFQTWQMVVETYQWLCSMPVYSQILTPVFDWAKGFSQSEQAKLFRTGIPGLYLIISTKEKHGLEHRDPDIVINVDDEKPETIVISYFVNETENIENFSCKSSEIMSVLQPLLDRL